MAGLAVLIAAALGLPAASAAPAAAEPEVPEGAPSAQESAERQEIYLNGDMWQFRPIKVPFLGWEEDDSYIDRSFLREAIEEVPDEEWENWTDVRVPSAWNSHHEFDYPDFWHYIHKGEYRRTFDVPESFDGKRIALNFEGVNWQASVYVNDTLLHAKGFEDEDFTHEFALTPFELDISDIVESGSTDNELRVEVHDITANMVGPSPREHAMLQYPSGLRGEYWNRITRDEFPRRWLEAKSGIFKDVSMTAVSDVYVDDVFVRPNQDEDHIRAEVTIRNADVEERTVTVDGSVVTWPEETDALDFEDSETVTVPAGEEVKVTLEQDWDDYQLWWPEDPNLYTMVTTLSSADVVTDVFTERFGVRDVHAVESGDVEERGVYVNGVRTALLGESIEVNLRDQRHGANPTTGVPMPEGSIVAPDGLTFNGSWGTTRSYFEHVIDVAKEMNINILRIHRGWSLSKELVEIADEKGMMLMAENPIIYFGWENPLPEEHRADGIAKVLQIAKHYRNHPSIVMWSISNEMNHYNEELEAGMREGFNGEDPINPDIQLVSAKNDVDGTDSEGYMGGYIPHETDKTWFTYEENASYVQVTNIERRGSVMDSMRIMRQQRMSLGYDAKILLAFYNFQKVFSLPSSPTNDEPMVTEIPWTEEEINGPGYNAQYMWQSLFNPYGDSPTTNYMEEFAYASEDLWATTFEPVAVFDQAWVDDAMYGTDPTADYSPERDLHLFNSDLSGDESTELTVEWRLLDSGNDSVIREGEFTEEVSQGGTAERTIDTGEADSESVRLELTVLKSGEVRFTETLDFGPLPLQSGAGGDVITIDDAEPGVYSRGLQVDTDVEGVYGTGTLMAEDPEEGALARFSPNIGQDGDHDIYVHVPDGLSGTQAVTVNSAEEAAHETEISLDSSGWVEVPGGPFPLAAGASENSVELVPGGSSSVLVADAVSFQRAGLETVEHEINQRIHPGAGGSNWEYLGRYDCEAGTACRVELTNEASHRVSADAVRFIGEDSQITLDEGQAHATGDWTRASSRPERVDGDMYFADPVVPADAQITYTPEIEDAGEYDVFITWDYNNGNQRAVDAPVTVYTDSVEASEWDALDDDMSGPFHWYSHGLAETDWDGEGVRFSAESTSGAAAIIRNDVVTPEAPFTYEFTARTNGAGENDVSIRSADYYIRLFLEHGTSGVVTDSHNQPMESHELDTTVDRLYRVVVHEDHTYDLYVDGELVWEGAESKGSGSDILKIGREPNRTADVTIGSVRLASEALIPELDELVILPAEAEVELGGTEALSALAVFSPGSELDVSARAEWSTDEASVATVDSGVVSGVSLGEAQISAEFDEFQSTAEVTVVEAEGPELTDLVISPAEAEIEIGETQNLSAVAQFDDDTELEVTEEATWTAEDEDVATVEAGLVTALDAGETEIEVSFDGLTASAAVRVVEPAGDPEVVDLILAAGVDEVEVDRSARISAYAILEDETQLEVSTEASWSVDDEQIAAVDTGAVTGLSTGDVEVSATFEDHSAAVVLEVIDAGSSVWDVLDDAMLTEDDWREQGPMDATWGPRGAHLSAEATSSTGALIHNDFSPPEAPFTYEFTAQTHGAGATDLSIRSDDYYIRVFVEHGNPGFVADHDRQILRSSLVDTTTTERTYRVVVHEDHTYDVYVDGEFAWGDMASKGSGADILKMGREPGRTADVTLSGVRVASEALVPDEDPELVEIVVEPEAPEVEVGGTTELTATARYDDDSEVDVTEETSWASDDESVASVDGGVVTGHEEGSAEITAALDDQSGSITVTVLGEDPSDPVETELTWELEAEQVITGGDIVITGTVDPAEDRSVSLRELHDAQPLSDSSDEGSDEVGSDAAAEFEFSVPAGEVAGERVFELHVPETDAATAVTSEPITVEVVEPVFPDVPTDSPFYDDIVWLSERGITTGWSDGTFRPLANISREAMVTFLYRYQEEPEVELPAESPFSDIDESEGFYTEMIWAYQEGITNGYPDGTFRPRENISREAIAAFMYRAAGEPEVELPEESPFVDVDPSEGFYTEMIWMYQEGITTGWPGDDGLEFRPRASLTREAMAAFIVRFEDAEGVEFVGAETS